MRELRRKLTLAEHATIWLFEKVLTSVNGMTSRAVLEEGIRTLGIRGWVRYATQAAKLANAATKHFDEAPTQTLIGLAGMLLGCGVCGYGHTLTGALILYREKGILHPIHPRSLEPLYELEFTEIVERVTEMLSQPEFVELGRLFERMCRIYLGELTPESREDELLAGILDLWRWTTECTIIVGVEVTPDEALVISPVGRDKGLRRRYEEARQAERVRVGAASR